MEMEKTKLIQRRREIIERLNMGVSEPEKSRLMKEKKEVKDKIIELGGFPADNQTSGGEQVTDERLINANYDLRKENEKLNAMLEGSVEQSVIDEMKEDQARAKKELDLSIEELNNQIDDLKLENERLKKEGYPVLNEEINSLKNQIEELTKGNEPEDQGTNEQ